MAKALVAARLGFRRLFSISAFTPPPAAAPPPKADPSTNLFVSGLSKRTSTEGLREAFSKFGEVVHAKVVTDRVSGYSKGFGFVRYASIEEAEEGIKGMDGKFLDGWVIFAEYARPRQPPNQDQSSQPQFNNYGSAPQSNYSSPLSQSTSYYTSAATSNYSSQAPSQPPLSSSSYSPQATQPPLSNSYYAPQTSQPQQSYGGSVPPSNYESVQSQSGYASSYFNHTPQTSQPPPSNGSVPATNYESVQSQSGYASSYFNHTPQTSQPPPSNGSVAASNYESVQSQSGYASSYFNHSNASSPPFNYSSEISQPTSNPSTAPSWYSSPTSQPGSYMSEPPNYAQSHYGSSPVSNHSSQTQNNSLKSENPLNNSSPRNSETFEPSSSYSSELKSDFEPGRAANY
ncbi:putative protein TPRXL [Dendrobium catenatum]|uniref:putative protein TPRXL n=1 Tax=Dendrobium catenatum TaxID=906689 RepID=UPI0009F1D1B0|nr:putative protein TPRXL [Dendrobium catenatum]